MSQSNDNANLQFPPAIVKAFRIIRGLWHEHPVLTLLGGFFLVVFIGENDLAEPILGFAIIGTVCYFLSKTSCKRTSQKKSSPNEENFGDSATEVNYSNSNNGSLVSRIEALEKKLSKVQDTEEDLLKRTESLGLPRPKSLLAFVIFMIGIASLAIPAVLAGSIVVAKYLSRPELSPTFLTAFNEMELDRVLYAVNFVDFDFFATFFGVILIPAFALIMGALLISVRTLFKRQRGFLLSFMALGFLSISFVSFGVMWKCMMSTSHRWNKEIYQASENSIEHYQQELQSPINSFGKKVIAVKELQKLDTPEGYKVLIASLKGNNAVLQQLILQSLHGHVTKEHLPQIEKLLQQTSDRRFQYNGVQLISTIPDKEVAFKLLEYDVPLSVNQLLKRFNKEDLPKLQEKLYDPLTKHKFTLLRVLFHMDRENTLKTMKELASSHENSSQYMVLRLIERYSDDKDLYPLLSKLVHSEDPSIHHKAKRIMDHIMHRNRHQRRDRTIDRFERRFNTYNDE